MFGNVGSLVLYVLLALAILILPGLALLRLALPGKTLGILCRIAIAPGITVAISVLVFTWCQVFGLKPGPVLPWVLIVAAGFVFVFVRPGGFALPQWLQTSTRRRLLRVGRWRLRRVAIGDAMAGITLVILLIVFFVVRFHATWKWFVPPGADSAQHTIIVQLLIENGGLFESWAPYSDAQTFTYHFGFHAVTVLFAWWLRLDALEAVFIMARVAGAIAALSLFTLVRLWSRSAWGGLFAVTFWFFYSGYLQSYDLSGRWALLTGLTAMTSCVVLISIYLRQRTTSKQLSLGLLCAAAGGGVTLTHYKIAIIFAILVASLVAVECFSGVVRDQRERFRRMFGVIGRVAVIAGFGLLLAAPRLNAVMHTRTGRYLNHLVFDGTATPAQIEKSISDSREMLHHEFSGRRRTFVLAVALIGILGLAIRKRDALWFVFGWAAVTLFSHPSWVGSMRYALIDKIDWQLAIEPAIASLAGLAVGFVCDTFRNSRSILWNSFLMVTGLALGLRGATGLHFVGDWCAFIVPQEIRLMRWIEHHVPQGERIAGRGTTEYGESMGYDAMIWLPLLTRHQTNDTPPGAWLEQRSPDTARWMRSFTEELYRRDMSAPESAQWMRQQGFRWFYVGALFPDKDTELLDQLARNPAMEAVQAEGPARLYHVK